MAVTPPGQAKPAALPARVGKKSKFVKNRPPQLPLHPPQGPGLPPPPSPPRRATTPANQQAFARPHPASTGSRRTFTRDQARREASVAPGAAPFGANPERAGCPWMTMGDVILLRCHRHHLRYQRKKAGLRAKTCGRKSVRFWRGCHSFRLRGVYNLKRSFSLSFQDTCRQGEAGGAGRGGNQTSSSAPPCLHGPPAPPPSRGGGTSQNIVATKSGAASPSSSK